MKGPSAIIAEPATGSIWSSERPPELGPVPELPAPGWLGGLRQSRSFQRDWQGFLARAREQTGSSAFRMRLGGPLVAVICGVGVRAMRDPERFARMYGFGPRRPSPRVIGPVVPTIFTDGELHHRRKALHLQLYREAWPELDGVLRSVLDEALPRWEKGQVRMLGPELERMVARVLFRWLLGAEPPLSDVRAVGNGVIPFRPTDALALPGDRKVRAAHARLVRFICRAPRMERLRPVAASLGIDENELARDLAFVLPMNAWAALSGALISTMAELTRHPEHRERIACDPAHARDVVREVLRLHPPAPAMFTVARQDGPLLTSTGAVLIRKGELVMGMLSMAHRDPRVFDDPDAFRPDRFQDPSLANEVLWSGGPEGHAPTLTDRVCPGHGAVRGILHTMVAAIARGRWALTRRPEWGTALTPRGVPPEPLELLSYRRGPEGLPWTAPVRALSLGDRLRMGTVRVVRALQRRSVEVWSARTYRTKPQPSSRLSGRSGPPVPQSACSSGRSGPPVPQSACSSGRSGPPVPQSSVLEAASTAEVLGARDMPRELMVPRTLPSHGAMGTRYVIPYYYAAGALFGLLERAGLDPRTPFRPDHPALRAFGDSPEGWGNLQEDETFGRLRLQGPNPYLLTADQGSYVADYGPAFEGIAPALRCRFEVDGMALVPVAIEMEGRRVTPQDSGWRRAKLLANALDARLTVFGEHLGRTHLVIAQAFAIARFQLPAHHPLRPFFDLHAFATLQVNDFAYKLLVSPSSYFVRSGFISRDQITRLFHNLVPKTDALRLLPERDIVRRGLDALPWHPYAEDALAAWAVLRAYTGRVVDSYYNDDAEVRADAALMSWDHSLRSLLPCPAASLLPVPRNRASLAQLLAAWVFNNVSHEVCGDFSPYVSGCDAEQARLVDFDRLRMGMENGPVSLAGVFLMKQGAYAGLFDTRGNSMLRVSAPQVTPCPAHAQALRQLQIELGSLSREVRARNADRPIPFLRMDPAKWELSIGF